MPFPFLWTGALLAGAFLALVMTLFAFALRFVAGTMAEVRGSVLPGLVSGFRDWAEEPYTAVRRLVSPRSPEPGAGIEDVTAVEAPTAERLHPHLR